MEIDTIVTLEGNEKYYLADVTIQNDVKYFLANKLDEKEELTKESCIFEEVKDGDEIYLDEVLDQTKLKYITTVFTSSLISDLEDEINEEA
ncbi:MAG: hypothetical protein PHG03_01855 [Bacilli bacterium]|nr:hypothetical protein [Bacilli bacterium]MDD4795290.1 hypothetical protein [Bacilli bacterium]